MKKLLLSAAFVLLSFSVQAQGLKSWLPAFDGGPVKGLKAGPGMKRVGADALKKNAAARAAATAIGGAGVKDGAGVVSTEYYDLSGRRTDGAAKGVGIKVEKYADGTSKAVKVLR